MFIKSYSKFQDLEPLRADWDRLAGDQLFRSWTWFSKWWEHYGDSSNLHVLVFFDESNTTIGNTQSSDQVVGIMPIYVASCLGRGRVLRLPGDGKVCTDHLDLLVSAGDRQRVAAAAAEYWIENANLWDATDFQAVGNDCRGLHRFAEELNGLGCRVDLVPNVGRWAIPLPGDWEAFLSLQSKSHRKKIRRLNRNAFDNFGAKWHIVDSVERFEFAWPLLIDLHQRRRNSLGEPGCFASSRWAGFHREIAADLLDQGRLRLSWLEVGGRPVAAEYQFADDHSTYAYQSGLETEALDLQPGRLSLACTIKNAIEEGHTRFDLMRGDESYKAQWKAEPVPTFDIRAVSPGVSAFWRNRAFTCLKSAVSAAKSVGSAITGGAKEPFREPATINPGSAGG